MFYVLLTVPKVDGKPRKTWVRCAHDNRQAASFETRAAAERVGEHSDCISFEIVSGFDDNIALEVAKENYEAHQAAQIEFTFKVWAVMTDIVERERLQRELDEKYGYRHGWYRVGDYSFCRFDITGESYDYTQGGWAFL